MIRVATIPFQRSMQSSIAISQDRLTKTQTQLATGKKANSLSELGDSAPRVLAAQTLLAAQDAQGANATRLGTTLSLYDANINNIDAAAGTLRTQIMTALGTGQTVGLQGAVEQAFQEIRSALNANSGGGPLFSGSQADPQPFKPASVAGTIGQTPDTAFTSDDVRASARVGDNLDVTYGINAKELGSGMLAVFRTLAEVGTIGATPTAAQTAALKAAVSQLDTATSEVRTINGENGRKQEQVETLATRADERGSLLKSVISEAVDADYGQIATNLQQEQMMLKASYSVFGQLAGMSLVDYIR
ncbi:MAG TPA: flagellin [Sphingomonas sp.]|jgi:flagellar hook-associated protein 3 FlgL|nr:flagellin [Sphingomonas sp.]